MRKLNWQLKALCHNNPEGSFQTRNLRSNALAALANQLYEGGYRHVTTRTLKPKHVEYLVKLWLDNGINERTIANRLSYIRWWVKHAGLKDVVHRSNTMYGLSKPADYATKNKAIKLTESVEGIKDPYVKMSLKLQAAFGLRREESIKFIPSLADRTDEDIPYIWLKQTWCKGGRPRNIIITNPEQLETLKEALALAGPGRHSAMIPKGKNYIQQRRRYDYQCKKIGMNGGHGLRHAYAQRRYKELTGHNAPILGGQCPPDEHGKAFDRISDELGHGRRGIVESYCGRLRTS